MKNKEATPYGKMLLALLDLHKETLEEIAHDTEVDPKLYMENLVGILSREAIQVKHYYTYQNLTMVTMVKEGLEITLEEEMEDRLEIIIRALLALIPAMQNQSIHINYELPVIDENLNRWKYTFNLLYPKTT